MSARTDFFSAVLDGDEAKAREIFADGRLDANVRDGLIGRDAPALSLAARSGMVDLARDLLNHGANPNLYDGVQAPIHHAKSPQLVEMLAKAGANLNAPTLKQMDDVTLTREGSTALHMAVHANNPEMVAALLAHKANPLAVDAAYRTPEQYAIDRPDLLEPLQQARENLSRQQAPTVEQAAPAAPAIETPVVEQARAMDGADLEDRVNALLAGVDPLTIDGGEQVAEYLAMSGEALSREPVQLNAGDAQKQAAPEVNTIGPAEGEREPGRPAAAPDTAPGVEKTPDAGKDGASVSKDDEDEQRAKRAPILDKNGYEIPQSVKALYVAVEGKFVDRKTEQIAFEDIGRKLSTKSEDRKVVEHMIEVAQAKNWGKLELKGTEAFRRQAWIAAQVAGLETSGYKPTEQDRAAVEARRAEMRIGAGEKNVEQGRENTIAADATKAKGDPAQDKPAAEKAPAAPSPAPAAQPAQPAQNAAQAPAMTPEAMAELRKDLSEWREQKTKEQIAEVIARHSNPAQRQERAAELLRSVGRDPAEFFPEKNNASAPGVADPANGKASVEPAPGSREATGKDQAVLSTREAVLSQILETEMNNKGLPPEERQALRDNLNAAFAGARAQGVELDIPEPMVFDRGDAPDPGKSVEVAQAQPAQTQEVER